MAAVQWTVDGQRQPTGMCWVPVAAASQLQLAGEVLPFTHCGHWDWGTPLEPSVSAGQRSGVVRWRRRWRWRWRERSGQQRALNRLGPRGASTGPCGNAGVSLSHHSPLGARVPCPFPADSLPIPCRPVPEPCAIRTCVSMSPCLHVFAHLLLCPLRARSHVCVRCTNVTRRVFVFSFLLSSHS